MTEHNAKHTTKPASKGAGAPGKEIEVTPAMIEAGARVLADYDPKNWSDEEGASIIAAAFIAMEKCRRR